MVSRWDSRSSAEGARIKAPEAPRGKVWEGVSFSPAGKSLGRRLCPSQKFVFNFWHEMVYFGVFYASF